MDDSQLATILQSLSNGLDRVEALVGQVPLDRWAEVIHTGDGAWSRRQLLAHMAANDLRQLVRIRIGAGIPLPGDALEHAAELEVHDWNRARVSEREGEEVAALLGEMRQNRAALVSLLRSLTPDQRERMMPFRGVPTPLADLVPVLIVHLDNHAAELVAGLG